MRNASEKKLFYKNKELDEKQKGPPRGRDPDRVPLANSAADYDDLLDKWEDVRERSLSRSPDGSVSPSRGLSPGGFNLSLLNSLKDPADSHFRMGSPERLTVTIKSPRTRSLSPDTHP